MAVLVQRLQQSGVRLRACGEAFVADTRSAGRSFARRTRKATETFVRQTRGAGETLVEQTKGAGERLAGGVGTEATAVREAFEAQGEELTREVRELLRVGVLERRLLSQVHDGLSKLDEKVEGRIEALAEEAPTALPPPSGDEPVEGYAALSAKAVVQQLGKLTPAEVEAVYVWERAHKKRATVLKAAKAALAA